MKKKLISILLMAAVAAGSLAGCGKSTDQGSGTTNTEGKVINIYCGRWNGDHIKRWNRNSLDH